MSVAGINPGSYAAGIQANFAGNQGYLSTSASATLTVTPPPPDGVLGFTGVPGNITVNATDSSGAVVTYIAPSAVDEADPTSTAAVSCSPASGSTFATGATTVTCTATDFDDTSASATFIVTVNDTDLGITGMPANIAVDATSTSGAVVSYSAPTAVDETGETSAAVGCTPASGSAFAIGTSTVTCTATDPDDAPASVTKSFTVTVSDTDLALSGVPANISVTATGPNGAVVTFAAPAGVDEAGDSAAATATCAPASGSTFKVGTTTVTCTASSADDSPATVATTFSVTVLVDMNVAASVSPNMATTGTLVTGKVVFSDTGAVSRTVTLVVNFVDPSGAVINSTKAVVKVDAGQTATRTFTFKVAKSFPPGTYSFVATASDVTGTVVSSAPFTVT